MSKKKKPDFGDKCGYGGPCEDCAFGKGGDKSCVMAGHKLKWFIVGGDWKTPNAKPCGRGEGKDMKAVCKDLKSWIGINMASLADRDYWRFIKQEDGATIIDFGSWSFFARVEGEE